MTSRANNSSIEAIILAAGRSRRMGTQKLLLPFAAQTVIAHIVDQVLAAPVRRAIIVVSSGADDVRAAVSQKSINLVENPNPDGEMLSSVRVGLRAIGADASAALIVLGDQPSLRADLISKIVGGFESSARGIVAPVYNGRRGHPLLIARRYFDEILTRYDAVGLRRLLAAHPDDVHDIPIEDPGVVADMDYPEDYQREVANHRGGNPTDS
jgi:molybdenum cofactor cytidylyltransferase